AEQADAAVINVTSGLAFVPMAAAPTYCATKAAMHSYTLSLRQSLKGRIEVIEIAPPAVQTQLTPGQETRSGYQPLAEFADEVMALLSQQPTPAEILVKQVQPLRHAEAEGHFEEKLALLNMPH
ncbi:SDR family NAD(P)-dependent oxidoreductase, partial [Paracoccus sp. (in: a-proteobacteria)]|uniref:SDR family NAD(P)-dependent oxidoreductase n=1 Tax=Paracoccus sp. TaxID=267 RepID=UPI00396CD006